MSWEVSNEMCRACMRVDGVLLPMYDGQLGSKNLPVKLAELASIQINKFDGLPSKLCAKCAYRTDAFYDFKLQVQASEKKLRELFQTEYSSQIKLQINSEDEEYYMKSESAKEKEEPNVFELRSSNDETINYKQTKKVNTKNVSDKIDSQDRFENEIEIEETEGETMVDNLEGKGMDDSDDILKWENSEYTLVYLSDTPPINSTPDSQSLVLMSPEDADDNVDSYNSWTPAQTSVKNQYSLIHGTNSKPVIFYQGKVVEGEDSETDQKCKVDDETSNTVEGSEDEESDYFADSKDNILGSLNDTIIKIKEIKISDNTINYQCTLCMQNYEQLTGALNHIVDNHVPASGPFFCTVCEKDCDNRRELRSHVKLHTGDHPYVCFICQKAYTVKRYLKRHMVSHAEFFRHRCPKCGERFKVKSELETHVTSHIRGSPYVCSQCPRVFNHKGNYKRHLITHLDPHGLHLPKFPCKICGKRFLNNRTLETHMRVHTGEKPFKCNVCNKYFSQQGNLLNHMRIHSNPRSYTCEVCGKQFNQRSTLKDHSLLHTGEKPYVCTVCGIAFTFSAALRRHMWTHASGKPYGCEVCDARFVGKYDLKRHMSIHTDRPRPRKRKNQYKQKETNFNEPREDANAREGTNDNTETVLIEQVLLNQDVTQVVTQEESEKENVNALFTLIQYTG